MSCGDGNGTPRIAGKRKIMVCFLPLNSGAMLKGCAFGLGLTAARPRCGTGSGLSVVSAQNNTPPVSMGVCGGW
jgi:hypothetical protein